MRSRASDSRLWIDPKRSKGDLATAVRISPWLSLNCGPRSEARPGPLGEMDLEDSSECFAKGGFLFAPRASRPAAPHVGFTMKTMSATRVHPERAMFCHERPVRFDLPRRALRTPSQRLRHPRGDNRGDLERLILRFVEEPKPPDEDIRQREGHLLVDRDVDLRPHMRPSLDDRFSGRWGVQITGHLVRRVAALKIEGRRFVEAEGEKFFKGSDGRAERTFRRRVPWSLPEPDFHHVGPRPGPPPVGGGIAPRDGDRPGRI